MTQREVRIWSFYIISVEYGKEQRPFGEEMGDMVVLWPCLFGCSPREEKIRVVPEKGLRQLSSFGRLCF